MLVLTSVNGFAFRFEILYLCVTEVEIALEIRVISTFFVPKNPFLGVKNKLLILAPQIDIVARTCRLNVNVC